MYVIEPFGDVLKRQVPKVPGEPITMTSFQSDLPKSCGNAWKGAYSCHGIWYKIQEGGEEDFTKLVALSFEQDAYHLRYEDYSKFKKLSDSFYFLVAKNLRGDIMGGVAALVRKRSVQLGAFFVQEDYRHSGIGSQLFGQMTIKFKEMDLVFNSMHHLHPTLYQFGLHLQLGRKIFHYIVNKPEGFEDLQINTEMVVKTAADLTKTEKIKLTIYLEDVTGQKPMEVIEEIDSLSLVIFQNEKCIGFGKRTETAGGEVKRILISPLYSNENQIAEMLLKELLKGFYKPEEDFDFDPDPLAIYRREVHLFIPEANSQVLSLIEKLAGEPKKVQKHRLWYQTASNNLLSGARLNRVFACENPHYFTI